MKTLVLGLLSADADLLFGLDDLPFLRRLMEVGCYGRLESIAPSASITAWECLATSQAPDGLGLAGPPGRVDASKDGPGAEGSPSVAGPTVWDHLAGAGKTSILVGVPSARPPRKTHGISVGSFFTPHSGPEAFTHPDELAQELRELAGRLPMDVDDSQARADVDPAEQILAMSRTQFLVGRHLLQTRPWDDFQLVDPGLDRLLQGLSKDPDRADNERGSGDPGLEALRHYYQHLDHEIGKILELLDEDTIVLVISPHSPPCPDAARDAPDRDPRPEPGAFILAGPIGALGGEIRGATLLDIAPTLLDLAGHAIPPTMQGKSLVQLGAHESPGTGRTDPDEEQLIRDRLSGLGYI